MRPKKYLSLLKIEKIEYKHNSQMELAMFSKYPSMEIMNKILQTINSYYGHFRHANTYKLRKKLYENNFLHIQNYIEAKDKNFYSFKIKREILEKIKRTRKKE